MKPRLPVLGLLASGLLAGLAVLAWQGPPAQEPAESPAGLPPQIFHSRPLPARRSSDSGIAAQAFSPNAIHGLTGPESMTPGTTADSAGQAVPPPPLILNERELQARAARVEQAANRDLQQLVGLLDLSEAQQDRIFSTLARRSPDWHPAMQPVGAALPGSAVLPSTPLTQETPGSLTGPSLESSPERPLLDDIASELTPDQQEALANAELDRIAWWEEIIPQLLPPGDTPALEIASGVEAAAVNAGNGTAAAAPPPAPETVKEGGEVIILD